MRDLRSVTRDALASDAERRVLGALSYEGGALSTAILVEETGLPRHTVRTACASLVEDGRIERFDSTMRGRAAFYYIPEPAEA